MANTVRPFLKLSLFIFLIVSTSFCKVLASGSVQVSKEKKWTVVTVSGFPKEVTVLVVDEELNLLGVGRTNDLGATQIKLNKKVNSIITVRTVNGDYEATTRPKTREEELREIMADNKSTHTGKA